MFTNKLDIIEKYEPASHDSIVVAEKEIEQRIPQIYQEFLNIMNGACMNLCILYGTDDLVEMYKCNEFSEYAPEYISIGNDNGDCELIIKAEPDAVFCGWLDAGAIGSAEPEVWFDFTEWVEKGCPMDDKEL